MILVAQEESREEVLRLCESAMRQLGTDAATGARFAEEAYLMARRIKDGRALAESLRMKGHADHRLARYRRAVRTYERAIRILDGLGEQGLAARTRSSALQTLIYLGRYDDALQWARAAREAFAREGDALRLARLETNTGNIFHRQERFGEAVAAYENALGVLIEKGDRQSAAITLKNLAVAHIGLLQFEQALERFEQAREILATVQLPVLSNEVDDNIAYLYYLEGDYTRAMELYQATRVRPGHNPHKFAMSLLDQSDLYLELNLTSEAARCAFDAVTGFEKLGMRPETARALQNLGFAYLQLGHVEESLRALDKATRIFEREKNGTWAAVTDLYRALSLHTAKLDDRALALAESARERLTGSALRSKEILASILVARLHLLRGNLAQAKQIVKCAQELLGATRIPHLQLNAELLLAETAHACGDLGTAKESYEKAHLQAEVLRRRLVRDEMQLSFLEDKGALYRGLVELLLKDGDIERAFLFIEHAKARSFSESLHRAAADRQTPKGVAAQLRLRLRRYYRRLDYLEARPNSGSAELLNEIRMKTAACERELAMAPADPGVREFAELGTGEVQLAAIQARLSDDEAFLQYFALRNSLVLLAIRKKESRCFDLGPMEAVEAAYRLMRFQLSRGGLPWADALEDATWLPASQRHLEALYRLLIEPARDWLPEGHWTIAPHRDLHRVPFHALRHAGRYLIDDRTISYAPSAGIWLQCLLRTYPVLDKPAVFGVPDYRCPAIAEEASSVANLLPGAALFLGAEATMDHLSSCGNSAVIHIASHGLYRADNPAFSSIQLADNRLTLFDLRRFELNAELVTLSGCATGVHESAGADEILGLTRGILLAGARAAHVSLWAINDESTAEYMTGFYRGLAAGVGVPEALRLAMIGLRDHYPHPFFWAPFALTGGLSPGKILRGLYQTEGAAPLH